MESFALMRCKNPIDWEGKESVARLAPGMTTAESPVSVCPEKGWIWVSSSGTLGAPRWIALTREAILCSAAAVNRYLDVQKEDVWLHALPDFHIAGIAIEARAYLSGSSIVRTLAIGRGKWDVAEWLTAARRCTLSALVPTQVHDIVATGGRAPESMRAIVVGGGALLPSLYREACALGWPLLPSYGLTECASQVATGPGLLVLPHVSLTTEPDGTIVIESRALFSAIYQQGVLDLRKEGAPFRTSDRGEVIDGKLTLFGRSDDVVKIGGECVDVHALQSLLDEVGRSCGVLGPVALVPLPDSRQGNALHLAVQPEDQPLLSEILHQYTRRARPFERIQATHIIDLIPKNALGKVRKGELRSILDR